MDKIRNLRTFTRTAETGSFASVARETHESHSAVTRQIAQLESHFGVRLFHRNTRSLSLTDDGRELLGYANQLLEMEDAMEGALRQQRTSPHGLVRLGTTIAFSLFLVPRIPLLLERYPGLALELVVRDHITDLIEERLDIAARVGPITDLSLVARQFLSARRVAVAAPAYLERRGVPTVPDDLQDHDCLLHEDWHDAEGWRFEGPNGPIRMRVSSRFCANNSEVLHAAVLSGQGVAMLPELRVIDDVHAGKLRHVLAEFQAPAQPGFIVYPSRRHLPPRTRVVIDFLLEQVRDLQAAA